MAVAPDGRVYAATSPDGAVYELDGTGKATPFFDPKEKYIWALAFDDNGDLFVATGGEGRVYRVARDGKASVVLTSTDTHILSLAVDRHGRLLAGSAPDGIVYHVDPTGRTAVLLDSSFREVRALHASNGRRLRGDGRRQRARDDTETCRVEPVTPRPDSRARGDGHRELHRRSPAGRDRGQPDHGGRGSRAREGCRAAHRRSGRRRHALDLDGGRPLLGVAGRGRRPRRHREQGPALPGRERSRLEPRRVGGRRAGHGARPGDGEDALVVSSNPARLYTLDGALSTEGSFTSKVKDAQTPSRWGELTMEGRTPPGTSVELQTRSGNTEQPDATWSEWSAPVPHASARPSRGARPLLPGARDARGKGAPRRGSRPSSPPISSATCLPRSGRSRCIRPARCSRSRSPSAATPRFSASILIRSPTAPGEPSAARRQPAGDHLQSEDVPERDADALLAG